MRASQRLSTLVAATCSIVALSAACASRRPTPDPKPEAVPGAVPAADSGDRPSDGDRRDISVGYGSQSRRELTVAVGSVTERDIGQTRVTRVEELLQGRVAGVHVTRRANGELSVRIRGASSFTGGGEPLWVLDNMPINTSIAGALAGLNPQDIERIDVLKDAGATAIYGSRGMYGVILIKTKHR